MNVPSELLVSISGIRGFCPQVLTADLAYAFTAAFARLCPAGPIVVSRDSRPTGLQLKEAVIQALADSGREILDADLVPLPTTQLAVEELNGAGAIDITASHNPGEYNGLKFLNSDGTFLLQSQVDLLKQYVQEFDGPGKQQQPQVSSINQLAIDRHIAKLKPLVKEGVRLTVAVDAVNGSGSFIVPSFLKEIGCDVISIATDPSEPFPHLPEPLPENLVWTKDRLAGKDFDLCVVVDPDADRLVLIDEKGGLVWEEATIPLVARELLESGRSGSLVINMSTSRMTEDVATEYGSTVVRSAVGERNVVTKMQEIGAVYGAEGGGGIIDPEVHYGRDSLVGIAHIVSLLRRTGKPLSQLVAELPVYHMQKTKVSLPAGANIADIYRRLELRYSEAAADYTDGLRLDFGSKWIHFRPSNTEPIFRIIAEAPSQDELEDLIDVDIFGEL